MAKIVIGIFRDSKSAGGAVADLKKMPHIKDISVIARDDHTMDLKSYQVKKDVGIGMLQGSALGAAIGGLTALIPATTPAAVISIGGLIVSGHLAVILAAFTGAATGGIVGGFVNAGVPEAAARQFEERLSAGYVIITVDTDELSADTVEAVLKNHLAGEVNIFNKT